MILLTTLQFSLPGSVINQLTTLTACVMSGLVHIMAYIRLSTADVYDTRDIFILSTSLLGFIPEDNLNSYEVGVEIGIQFCMLKHHKTLLK